MTDSIQRNFNLYPADLETLNQVAERLQNSGPRNLSAALRHIISEWRKGGDHADTNATSND